MKPKAIGNARKRRAGTLPVLLAALSLLVPLGWMGGCGGLNDSPGEGGVTVTVGFSAPQTQEAGGGFSAQAIVSPAEGDPVKSLVVGAVVISRAEPFTNAEISSGGLSDAEREALENDAEQSAGYLEIVQLPYPGNFVSFPLPPSNAGNWQLVAVGLRHSITSLDQVENNSPIWYGFTDFFMNDLISPGDTYDIIMQPWCQGNLNPPDPIGDFTGACL